MGLHYTGWLAFSWWQPRTAFMLLALDFVVCSILLLINGIAHRNYFKFSRYDVTDTVFDVTVIMYARVFVLALVYQQAVSLGTMYRVGYDGFSYAQTQILRTLVLALPIISIGFGIYKVLILRVSRVPGQNASVVSVLTLGIGFPLLELVAGYIAFVHIRYEGPDYKYLEMIEAEDEPTERTGLLERTSSNRSESSTVAHTVAAASPPLSPAMRSSSVRRSTTPTSPAVDVAAAASRAAKPEPVATAPKASETPKEKARREKEERKQQKKDRKKAGKARPVIEVVSEPLPLPVASGSTAAADEIPLSEPDSAASAAELEADPDALATTRLSGSLFPEPVAEPAPEPEAAPTPAPTLSDAEKRHRKRTNVVREIIATEETYIRTLKMLIDLYVLPLREAAEKSSRSSAAKTMDWKDGDLNVVIEKGQVKAIFLELETLHKVNSLLLTDLQDRFSRWSPTQRIADAFLGVMSYLKTYTTYANNFSNALAVLDQCKKQPSFRKFLLDRVKRPESQKMWLSDHLITPIQRIPRYILLLKELIDKTSEDHPDYRHLTQAKEEMTQLAQYINETKKRSERSVMMINVQRMVKRCPMIVEPSRQFLNDFVCVEMAVEELPVVKRESAAAVASSSDQADESGEYLDMDQYATTEDAEQHRREQEYMTTLATIDRASSAGQNEAAVVLKFVESDNVVLYLFNDMLLIATHVRVSGILEITRESVKAMARGDDVVRPVTVDKEGQETMHKFKYQRMAMLHDVKVEPYDNPTLKDGFVITFPKGKVYYESPSQKELDLFIETFNEVKAQHMEDRKESEGRRSIMILEPEGYESDPNTDSN